MSRGPLRIPLTMTPGGIREDVNIGNVPDGAWLAASNYLARQGQGQPRPGYSFYSTLSGGLFLGPVIGFGFSGTPLDAHNLWVATADLFEPGWDGTFNDGVLASTQPHGSRDAPVRFATFSNADGSIAVAVSPLMNVVLLSVTDSGSGPGPNLEEPVEVAARDVCIINNRVMVAHTFDVDGEHPYQVRWSDFNDPRTWPTGSANTAELADTSGEIIACAALGPLSAAIYKSDSLWIAQGIVAKNPFQFQQVGAISGPISTAAVIVHRGAHYWLGRDGVVYRFDGTQVDVVASGLVLTLRGDLYRPYENRVHGATLTTPEPELWWWYPSTDVGGLQTEAFALNLVTGAMTKHHFAEEITASASFVDQALLTIDGLDGFAATIDGLDAVYATIDSMVSDTVSTIVLGHDSGDPNDMDVSTVARISIFGITADDEIDTGSGYEFTDIEWSVTHGWKQPAPGSRFILDGVHMYWRRESSPSVVTITATATDSLGEAEHAVERTYDLAVDDNHFVAFGDLRGQFVKIAQSGTTPPPHSASTSLRCRGGLLTAWPKAL